MLYLIAGTVAFCALCAVFAGEDNRSPQNHVQVEEETYASLRAKAKQEGQLMDQCYRQSMQASERREHALAKTLSDKGKRHALEMERLNAEAIAIMSKERNQDTPASDAAHVVLYLIAGIVAVCALYALFAGEDHLSPYVPEVEEETCASLRAKAKQEGQLMNKCYQQSKQASERRERALAKILSDNGKQHALEMERLNARASAIVFRENNQDKPAGEVDLHGLYVKEAVSYAEKAVKTARQRGDTEIRFIVGQGNHSDGGISRLKPALAKAMKIRGAQVNVDPRNPGVLRVVL